MLTKSETMSRTVNASSAMRRPLTPPQVISHSPVASLTAVPGPHAVIAVGGGREGGRIGGVGGEGGMPKTKPGAGAAVP